MSIEEVEENRDKMIELLSEVKSELEQASTNISILIEDLNGVHTEEDATKWDEKADELLENFKHFEFF